VSADRRIVARGRGYDLAALPADAAARAAGLIAVAEDLAGEFSLRPLLQRILLRCTELLGCTAGSICSVDEVAGTYRKEADIGVACQSGQVFPLSEGMTGVVVARRAPVWFARYDQVQGGHVAAEDRATLRGVIGVPLEWRGQVIGACVVFSRDERRLFGPDDAELLELFARHAAIALATARMHEAAEERARAEATASERDRLLGEVQDSLGRRLMSIRLHLDAAETDLAETARRAAERRPYTGEDVDIEPSAALRFTLKWLLGACMVAVAVVLISDLHLHFLSKGKLPPTPPALNGKHKLKPPSLSQSHGGGWTLHIPWAPILYGLLVIALLAAVVISIWWSNRLRQAAAPLAIEDVGADELREAVESGRAVRLTCALRLAAVDVKEALCLSAGRARSWCPTGTSGSR